MTPVNLPCLLFSLLQDLKKGNFLDVDCPVYDIYVSMFLFSRVRYSIPRQQIAACKAKMSSNAMDARARGRGRGRRVGEGGAGLPAPGPPSQPRTLEERVGYLERRLDSLIFVVQGIAKDRDDDRREAWKCLAEVRNLNADILTELRRAPAPHPSSPP